MTSDPYRSDPEPELRRLRTENAQPRTGPMLRIGKRSTSSRLKIWALLWLACFGALFLGVELGRRAGSFVKSHVSITLFVTRSAPPRTASHDLMETNDRSAPCGGHNIEIITTPYQAQSDPFSHMRDWVNFRCAERRMPLPHSGWTCRAYCWDRPENASPIVPSVSPQHLPSFSPSSW